MKSEDLYELIDSLSHDIEFEYNGKHGSVCPFSHTDIAISYGDIEKMHTSVLDAMNDKIYDGKSLNQIADQLDVW